MCSHCLDSFLHLGRGQLYSDEDLATHVLLVVIEQSAMLHFGLKNRYFAKLEEVGIPADSLNLFFASANAAALVAGTQLSLLLWIHSNKLNRLSLGTFSTCCMNWLVWSIRPLVSRGAPPNISPNSRVLGFAGRR